MGTVGTVVALAAATWGLLYLFLRWRVVRENEEEYHGTYVRFQVKQGHEVVVKGPKSVLASGWSKLPFSIFTKNGRPQDLLYGNCDDEGNYSAGPRRMPPGWWKVRGNWTELHIVSGNEIPMGVLRTLSDEQRKALDDEAFIKSAVVATVITAGILLVGIL